MNNVRKQNGITLIALVITIIVLIILAGIAISMTLGENGIFTKAKEAKRLQITAEAKEKIGTDILDAQVEAVQKNETLQQSKVEEIIAKYGELQADGDTIKLKDNGYTVSLKEIYNGTTSSSGGSTGGSTGNAELDSIKAELAQTTATEDKILKDYKVYSNGKLCRTNNNSEHNNRKWRKCRNYNSTSRLLWNRFEGKCTNRKSKK